MNELEGTIPSSIGFMSHLKELMYGSFNAIDPSLF